MSSRVSNKKLEKIIERLRNYSRTRELTFEERQLLHRAILTRTYRAVSRDTNKRRLSKTNSKKRKYTRKDTTDNEEIPETQYYRHLRQYLGTEPLNTRTARRALNQIAEIIRNNNGLTRELQRRGIGFAYREAQLYLQRHTQ